MQSVLSNLHILVLWAEFAIIGSCVALIWAVPMNALAAYGYYMMMFEVVCAIAYMAFLLSIPAFWRMFPRSWRAITGKTAFDLQNEQIGTFVYFIITSVIWTLLRWFPREFWRVVLLRWLVLLAHFTLLYVS